jgi:hypothetical protein
MKNMNRYGAVLATALMAVPPGALALDDVGEALTGGKVSGNFRLRYEDVDIDSSTIGNASALTLRSRLGYETAPLHGFSALLDSRTRARSTATMRRTTGTAACLRPIPTTARPSSIRSRRR